MITYTHQDLLKRNIHLLLKYYNYLPENFIDRYNIDRYLQNIYDIFDGRMIPNKTNLRRISRLIGLPVRKLSKAKNLLPVILKHQIKKWHMTLNTLAKELEIHNTTLKYWYHMSITKDKSWSKLTYEKVSTALGITRTDARKIMSPKYYFHPSKEHSSLHTRLKQVMNLHLHGIRQDLHNTAESLEWGKFDENYQDEAILYRHLRSLLKLGRIMSDAFTMKITMKCQRLIGVGQVFDVHQKNADKIRNRDYHLLIRTDRLIKQLQLRYSSTAEYNYARSQKFSIIACIHSSGLDFSDSRLEYLVYGLHTTHYDFGSERSLTTYSVTTPGLANLDPGWREIDYRSGFGDYFHIFGSFHKMNSYVKDCTLSRQEIRDVIRFLHKQGLSYAKIIPCTKIDWWLNHHNAEYRDKGDERI